MAHYKSALLIYPYHLEVPIYEFFPPIGLEYIAAVVEKKIEKTRLVDLRQEPDFLDSTAENFDLILVSVNWRYGFESVINVINQIIQKFPDSTTIIGGREASSNPEAILKKANGVKLIVRGEGEEAISEIISLGNKLDDRIEQIHGISFLKNGKVIHNENRPLCTIDDYLTPARHLRKIPYRVSFKGWDIGRTFDAVLASRGCPYNCKFCSFKSNPLGQKRPWTPRNPKAVVDDVKETGAEIVAFLDDNFCADESRAEEICDRIIAEKLPTRFLVNARIEIGDNARLVRKLEKAGVIILNIGIESAVDRTLKMLSKGFTTGRVEKAMKNLSKSNMLINGYFIVGNIGETATEILSISKFARKIGLDIISLNRLRYEKYSSLGKIIDESEGYFVGQDGGVYSAGLDKKGLTNLLKKNTINFYTPIQVLRILRKSLSNGFIKPKQFSNLAIMLPWITARIIKGHLIRRYLRMKV